MKKKLFILLMVSLAATSAFAALKENKITSAKEIYPFGSSIDRERFASLTQEIRCVVCQNQNIAESNALLANDLREKIYVLITQKKSNDEIKNYLVARYGEFILLKPRFNKITFLLWSFPFFSLFAVLFFIFRMRVSSQR